MMEKGVAKQGLTLPHILQDALSHFSKEQLS